MSSIPDPVRIPVIARELGMTPRAVRRAVYRGAIRGEQPYGNEYIVSREEVVRYAQRVRAARGAR